jgi:hypothetical protein
MTIVAIFPDDLHPSLNNFGWAGSVVSDVWMGAGEGTHGGGSQNISSTTFSRVICEAISVATSSIKAPPAASCSDGVKRDKETWRNFRPCEPDEVLPSVGMDILEKVHPGGCEPKVVPRLLIREDRS